MDRDPFLWGLVHVEYLRRIEGECRLAGKMCGECADVVKDQPITLNRRKERNRRRSDAKKQRKT